MPISLSKGQKVDLTKGNPGLNKKYISQMKELSEIRKRNK